LFESSGYVVTHWERRRLDVSEAEIPVPASVPIEAHNWIAGDPEATTYQFVVRAVPADEPALLQDLRTRLGAATNEVESLQETLDEHEELVCRSREELAATREELAAVRRAHEVLQRRLVAERAAFAEGIAAVEHSVYGSRSWRYTAPLRGGIARARRLKP
jgi:hypothetical protein